MQLIKFDTNFLSPDKIIIGNLWLVSLRLPWAFDDGQDEHECFLGFHGKNCEKRKVWLYT